MLFLDVKFCLKIEMPSNNNLIKNIKPNIYIYIYIYIYIFLKKKKKRKGSASHPLRGRRVAESHSQRWLSATLERGVAYGRRRGVYVVQGEGGGGRNVDEREHEQSVPIQAAPAQGVVPRLTPTPKTTSQVLVTPLQAMLFLITATTSASEFRFRLPIISLSPSLLLSIFLSFFIPK
jgi:hypothetical protein